MDEQTPATPTPERQESTPQATEAKPEPRSTEAKPESEPKHTIRSELRAQIKKSDDKPEVKAQAERPKIATSETPAAKPESVVEAEPILPPADMSAAERAEFSKLPPEAQKYLSRRAYETRADYSRKTESVAAKEREIEQIAGLNLRSVRDEYAKYNIPLPTVIENAVVWDRAFRSNPLQAAREYLAAWGVDPASLTQAQPAQAPGYSPQQIEEMVTTRVNAALEQERQSHYTQTTLSNVESFKKDKPLFRDPGTASQLEAAMAPIVAGLRSQNPSRASREILDEAYSYVTRGNPQFADLLTKVDARATAEKARVEAEKAQSASRSISGGPGSGTPSKQFKTIRDSLRAAYHS